MTDQMPPPLPTDVPAVLPPPADLPPVLPPPYIPPVATPPAATPPPVPGSPVTCEICGRGPAEPIHAVMYSGKILLGDEIFWKGAACRQCAVCQYRSGLAHCLWAGWWSPIAFFVNPTKILHNARGLRAAHRMPAPQGAPLAPPLDEGQPVFRRPLAVLGALAPVVVVVALVALVLALTGSSRLDELGTGQCIDLPDSRQLDRTDEVACNGPHDAEVAGVMDDGDVPADQLCTDEINAYLGATGPVDGLAPAAIRFTEDPRVVCLITSDDDSPLVGSQRNAGR